MKTQKYRTELEKLKANIIADILKAGEVSLLNNLKEENQVEEDYEIVELMQSLPIIEVRYSSTGNVKDFYFDSVSKDGILTLWDIEDETENTSFDLYDLDIEQLLIILEEF